MPSFKEDIRSLLEVPTWNLGSKQGLIRHSAEVIF